MKIALLTPTFYEYSGIDRLVEAEALMLKRNHNKVTVFTFSATIKTNNAEIAEIGMPKNPTLQRIYRLFFFLDIKKVIKYTKALRDYDMAISYFYPMNLLAYRAKKFYKLKYVYYNAGVASRNLFERFSERLYLRMFNFLNNLTIKNADEIISISDFLRKELKKETGLESKVEYPAIRKTRFSKKINGSRIRRKYNLGDSPVVLYVGRISPHKGVHLLIGAFKIARTKIKNLKLIIVGKATFNSYFNRLKNISNSSKDIIFAGFIPDSELSEFYAVCNVYASASLWEGYNLPLAEAQAYNKPVVAFDLCSHPEVVKNGILVEPKSTEGFAQAIIAILTKPK